MSKIYDIRHHHIIDADGWTMRSVISAALGGELSMAEGGHVYLDADDGGELTDAGKVFRAAFGGRRFASMEAVAAHVIDCQHEQLELASMERAELIEALSRCITKLRAEDIREGLEPSDELEHALAVIAKAKGEA